MNKKICVYAICKNESKNIYDWYESMKEADKIIVLDTGSIDDSVSKLKELGVEVYEEQFEMFRFDEARNLSLSYVPVEYDICVCTDLDERFEPGWALKVKEYFKDDVTRLKYDYNWSFDENGNPGVYYRLDKIHKNKMYKWIHPVHEVLSPLEKENIVFAEGIVLNHHQDITKPRNSYLELLELSVKENPLNDRNVHYLGREYMYYKRWNECIDTLEKHLSLESATWKDERSASMRFIARSYKELGRIEEMIYWYKKAIDEATYLREAYVELAKYYYENKMFKDACIYLDKALLIKTRSISYINEEYSWNYSFYDMVSNCKYYVGSLFESYFYACFALELKGNDERILRNIEIIKNSIIKKI